MVGVWLFSSFPEFFPHPAELKKCKNFRISFRKSLTIISVPKKTCNRLWLIVFDVVWKLHKDKKEKTLISHLGDRTPDVRLVGGALPDYTTRSRRHVESEGSDKTDKIPPFSHFLPKTSPAIQAGWTFVVYSTSSANSIIMKSSGCCIWNASFSVIRRQNFRRKILKKRNLELKGVLKEKRRKKFTNLALPISV